MTTDTPPRLIARFRSRRSAAIAGIVFGVLLLAAMIMLRIALSEGSLLALQADAQRRSLIRLSLSLVPFAGIGMLRVCVDALPLSDVLCQTSEPLMATLALSLQPR